MSLTKVKKEEEVNDLVEKFAKAKCVIFIGFQGLNVTEVTELRRKLKKSNVEYKVIKNNIIGRALQKVNINDFEKVVLGPTAVIVSYDDPVVPAKILKEFASGNENLKVKAGILAGKIVDVNKIKFLAGLPGREVLVARVIGGMKSPLCNFVFVLKANLHKLMGSLTLIKDKKS
ncbi:MAG: 50S ribosomal protein L10 [Candidatus Firestonebacteria bacterium]